MDSWDWIDFSNIGWSRATLQWFLPILCILAAVFMGVAGQTYWWAPLVAAVLFWALGFLCEKDER
jgi:hypothetical protein